MQYKITVKPQFSLDLSGDIFIGDACYFFDEKRHPGLWSDFCNIMFPGGKSGPVTDGGVATITMSNGFEFEFIYASTAHGDGSYEVQGSGSFKEFGVDAGLFSAVRISALKRFNPEFDPEAEGVVIKDFDGSIGVSEGREGWMEGNGTNGFSVQTDGSDQDEDPNDGWGDWEDYDEEDEEEDEE
jgi:hypothetical protein